MSKVKDFKTGIQDKIKNHDWDNEIAELEIFFEDLFKSNPFIKDVQFDTGILINDVKEFVKAHLGYVKENAGNKTYLPYLERLRQVKSILNKKA